MRWVQWAANTLHDYLLRAGVKIYEYCERPMHAKVALIDDDWTTVGPSNLDPLSLVLHLEANLVVRDAPLADTLRRRVHNRTDPKRVVSGKSVSVRVYIRGFLELKPKKK